MVTEKKLEQAGGETLKREPEDTVGRRLRALRERRKWSQVKLAERAEVAQSTISELEADRYDPSLSTLKALAGALGVSVRRLIA